MSSQPDALPHNDAMLAACLLAVDPQGLGGIALRTGHGPAVDTFLKVLRARLPKDAPFRRMPLQIADGRLLGGLDLAATLQSGRPVLERGLLAEADGGCVVLPMAERLPLAVAARLGAVLDSKEIVVERDGFTRRSDTHLAVVALDEGVSSDERPPEALLDRLALHVHLEPSSRLSEDAPFTAAQIELAGQRLQDIVADDSMLAAFCNATVMLGIASGRAPLLAVRTARCHAALNGRMHINDDDAAVASRLVLAPRATMLPAEADAPAEDDGDQPQQEPPDTDTDADDEETQTTDVSELNDLVLDAARAAIPADLLATLQASAGAAASSASTGGAGAQRNSAQRGRPVGTRRGQLESGARLNVVETLRAAAPWQALRRQTTGHGRVHVRRDDFRLTRFKQHSESATIFVVDASGSSALHRLAEAKGAVELLLADCYVRRDQVALIAFRGKTAELILPPTRSLVRAKRSLIALPGGGGTPIAAALDAAVALADGLRRKGLAPGIVLLTDGRANVARDGTGSRERGEADALVAARRCRASRCSALLVDTSPSPGPAAERLAREMGARYLPLPRADAATISRAVRNATAQAPSAKAS
jgi:magnesium chelatase subunit D